VPIIQQEHHLEQEQEVIFFFSLCLCDINCLGEEIARDYDLLIIDDLGAERNTDYAMEQMFSIVDSRYRSGKPLIVTTNLKLDELKHPPDLAHDRIYDRILERCAPILFAGKNFREDNATSTKAAARGIVTPHSKN